MSSLDRDARVVVALAAAYVLAAGWSMTYLSYDIWGAFVVAPVLVLLTLPILRRLFRGSHSVVLGWAYVGLVAKLGGVLIRYWVGFSAYGGSIDANAYHGFGKDLAGQVRSGDASVLDLIPDQVGTQALKQFTAILYTVIGSSRMAAFLVFGWFGFLGAAMFVKAALIAVPGIDVRRYAAFVFLAPSIVYWPSSIGKEAAVFLCLGAASLGTARLVVGRWGGWSVPLAAGGMVGAAYVRPHMAGLWLVGVVIALVMAQVTSLRSTSGARRVGVAAVTLATLVGLSLVVTVTLDFLDPSKEESDTTAPVSERVTMIFDETERRTTQGGSAITPINVAGPQTWPYAVGRTLTRPLIYEVDSVAEMIPAVEMTALLVLAVAARRRFANLPRLALRVPYVAMAVTVLIIFGLVFARLGNLAILVRQRSVVMPLLLLLWCVPPRPRRDAGQNNSISPSVSSQLDRGGIPASLTSRQVSIGPPPGSGT